MSRNASVRLGSRGFALAAVGDYNYVTYVAVVLDVNGLPWPGVQVQLDEFSRDILTTDSKGQVTFNFPIYQGMPASFPMAALNPVDSSLLQQQVDLVQGQKTPTVFRFSTPQPQPILTTLEAVVLAGGIILGAVGFYKDHVIGNVVGGLGASLAASAVLSSAKRHIWG